MQKIGFILTLFHVVMWCHCNGDINVWELLWKQLSVPQTEYPLGGSSKKGCHVYVLLQVIWVILMFDINVLLMLPW